MPIAPLVLNPMNYNNKKFRPIESSANGETTEDTVFEYIQTGNVITCTYSGEHIVIGHLIGLVDADGNIDMRYHQVNTKGELMTGVCSSKPEIREGGKIRLHEQWKWTSGDKSSGHSILEEFNLGIRNLGQQQTDDLSI